MFKFAAVDGPDDDHLTAVKVFEMDHPSYLVNPDPRHLGRLLKRLGLARKPNRWVDITERPDIKEGDPWEKFCKPPEPVPAVPVVPAPVAPRKGE